jgi:methylated-DNA-[protein]-cysteine S-methyltransferase
MLSFKQKVLKVVRSIPKGRTMTYQEVARRANNPLAYRAVGSILAKNFDKNIPCHRVIKSDGSFGNYNRGIKNKIRLLRKEGAVK